MRVTFLGTGSAMPVAGRAQTGLLVESGGGTLLVDAGSGVLGRLACTDAGYEGVDAVLLTHHHLDHVADLLPLLKARWLAGVDTLSVRGPAGTASLLAELVGVHDYLDGKVAYEVDELAAGDAFELCGLRGESRETRHSLPCLAYRLTAGGEPPSQDETAAADGESVTDEGSGGDRGGDESDDTASTAGPTLVFSGDTEADPDLAAWADGADALVHDCSFPDDVDVSNHPTPSTLGAALAGNEFGCVYLTHCYPHTEGRQGEMRTNVAEQYDGDVQFARDGLTIEL